MQVLRELDLPIDGTSLKRLKKAIDAVDRGRVKKYVFVPSGRVTWIVVGRKRDYWVIPRLYCSCDDFYINVISRKSTPLCYHLLAQAIAERTGRYDVFNVSDEEGERLEEEWRRVL
jgi:predicted nucleic acid-binding Zn finger protein